MKLSKIGTKKFIKEISKKNQVSESVVGQIFKFVLSKKLEKDPEIVDMANRVKTTLNQVKNTIDKKVESGELKDTPALRKLKKELGID